MEERWRRVAGTENYSVSDKGRVRNDNTGRQLATPANAKGHPVVTMHYRKHYVARLVAAAFLDNWDDTKQVVNHNKGGPQNCEVKGLSMDVQNKRPLEGTEYRRHKKIDWSEELLNPYVRSR